MEISEKVSGIEVVIHPESKLGYLREYKTDQYGQPPYARRVFLLAGRLKGNDNILVYQEVYSP